MTATSATTDGRRIDEAVPTGLTLLLAIACGLLAANIYYSQSLAGPISEALGMAPGAAGLVVTATQIGYCLGLFLLAPLGDLIENRRLVVVMIALDAVALVGVGLSDSPAPFLAAALLVGLFSVAVQVLVPYAAHRAPAARRGEVVGNVMSGLMIGIMLARPAASFIAGVSSWNVAFFIAAGIMAALAIAMARMMPARVPETKASYGAMLASMMRLLLTSRVLQRRSLYHVCLFGAFSLFWTTAPLRLAGPGFGLTQRGIALFAFAGVSGAVASPIAGRIADRGWIRSASAAGMLVVVAAFAITRLVGAGSPLALPLMVAAAVMLDFGVITNLVLGQRAIFALASEHRGRLNGIFTAIFFAGGALASALGGWAYAHGGWSLATDIGAALPIAALAFLATE